MASFHPAYGCPSDCCWSRRGALETPWEVEELQPEDRGPDGQRDRRTDRETGGQPHLSGAGRLPLAISDWLILLQFQIQASPDFVGNTQECPHGGKDTAVRNLFIFLKLFFWLQLAQITRQKHARLTLATMTTRKMGLIQWRFYQKNMVKNGGKITEYILIIFM